MPVRTLDDIDVSGKRVLLRVDFNVPLSDGGVSDDSRMRAALPTIREVVGAGASVVLCSHLGRPKGESKPELSLDPVAVHLRTLLDSDVSFVPDIVGDEAQSACAALQAGEALLLENLRFDSREEANDAQFASQLAALADVYVNDAFGAAHRAHASTEGVGHYLTGYAGRLMELEINALTAVLRDPEQPLVVILGGAKISDKIGVVKSFLERAGSILFGGAMANTFLAATGMEVGKSLFEADQRDVARDILEQAKAAGVDVLLPIDVVVATSPDSGAESKTVSADKVGEDLSILDIGPRTIEAFESVIDQAGTIVWNGPLGLFEKEPFDLGTVAIARAVAASNGFSLVGGGDSVAALTRAGLEAEIDHVSTGGGASLEFLEGKKLPGIAILEDAE